MKTDAAKKLYTARQGQALAFTYYTKIHGEPPATFAFLRRRRIRWFR